MNALTKKVRTISKDTRDIRYVSHPVALSGGVSYGAGNYYWLVQRNIAPSSLESTGMTGDEINGKYLKVDIPLQGSNPLSGPAAVDTVRAIVFVEKEGTGTDPKGTTPLENLMLFPGIGEVSSPWKSDFSGQWKLLADRRMLLSQQPPGTAGYNNEKHVKWLRMRVRIPPKYQTARFDQATGDCVTNRIFVVLTSNQAATFPVGLATNYGNGFISYYYQA